MRLGEGDRNRLDEGPLRGGRRRLPRIHIGAPRNRDRHGTPAFDEIREEFSLADGSGEVSLVVTAYFLGMAAGQLPMGPLSIGSVAVRYCSPPSRST